MSAPEFSKFRLVGGTALSLQLGHRVSVDIDLFTDAEYNSIDFNLIENFLYSNFEYVDTGFGIPIALGKSFLIGENQDNSVKLDVYYTDHFIQTPITEEGVRIATIEEIIAMKVDVISRKGRKKDFWDIHELLDKSSLQKLTFPNYFSSGVIFWTI
jgi:predicted nucleotidyltransferase component of viral defense system